MKRNMTDLITTFATPTLMIILSLVLMFSPDSAAALVGRVLGWGLTVCGIAVAAATFLDRRFTAGRLLAGLVLLAGGTWLLRNPLVLAAGLGRFVGLVLLVRGGRDFVNSAIVGGRALSLVTAVLGLVLILLPMTTSRIVFTLLGVLILITAVSELLQRLKSRRGGKPDIIDAL